MEPVKEVLENTGAKICFLGDYLDPYPHEWEEGVDYKRIAIDRFKEIIQLKKDHPDRITLLRRYCLRRAFIYASSGVPPCFSMCRLTD